MNTKIKKHSFILILSFIVLSLMVSFLAVNLFNSKNNNAYAAETVIDKTEIPEGAAKLLVGLNINGKENTTGETADGFDQSSSEYSARIVSFAGFEGISSTYTIDNIYNPYTEFISVTESVQNFAVKIKAVSQLKQSDLKENKAQAVITITSGGSTVKVYLRVYIESTFIHENDAALKTKSNPFVLVGAVPSFSNGAYLENHTITPVTLRNNESFEIKFQDDASGTSYVKGRQLYAVDSASVLTGAGDKMFKENNGDPWVLKNTDNFKINGIPYVSGLTSSSCTITPHYSEDGSFSPSISIDVNISSKNKDTIEWEKTTALLVNIVRKYSNNNITLIIPVKFVQSSTPLTYKIPAFPTSLNAGANESSLFTSTNDKLERDNPEGYKKTEIYPRDLVDYPASVIYFRENTKPVNNFKLIIEIDEIIDPDNKEKNHYLITAKTNGFATLDFVIFYTDPSSKETVSLTVQKTFTVYGAYELGEVQLNAKKVSYNINNIVMFNEITQADFFLVKATLADAKYATVSVEQGNLIMQPHITGITDITFYFQSRDGKKIEVTTKLNVNLARGNWWASLQSWQRVLFIVGGILLLIILILFITWLFIRAIHSSKRNQNETVIPTSSYIVKLNSTIAAAQAQQRLATQGYGGGDVQTQALQLGAGPTTTQAPNPTTMQLGVSYGAGAPQHFDSGAMNMPPIEGPAIVNNAPHMDDIYIPMSDEALIERIYIEKYEPRGMTRRSFFKSKDLQVKELEKEKIRIRENVRNGMTIDEACKTDKQREQEANGTVISSDTPAKTEVNNIALILGFDPYSPVFTAEEPVVSKKDTKQIIIDKNGEQKFIYDELSEEDEALLIAQKENDRLIRESVALKQRLDKVAVEKKAAIESAEAQQKDITAIEKDIKALTEIITDIEVKMTIAKGKEKEKLSKEIVMEEDNIKAYKAKVITGEQNLVEKQNLIDEIEEVSIAIKKQLETNESMLAQSESNLKSCENRARLAKERAEKAKLQQNNERQASYLTPILESLAICDKEMMVLQNESDLNNQQKAQLKSEVSSLQTQLLSATDSTVISNLSEAIKEKNQKITELEKEVTAASKKKADKASELAVFRKRANDFIQKEDIALEDIIAIEDKVLAKMALEDALSRAEKDRADAEDSLILSQSIYDELVGSMDEDLARKAEEVALNIKRAEEALAEVQVELDSVNLEIELADDDDKLMLSINQMSLQEKLDELSKELEKTRANGIKSNLEFKLKCEEDIKEAGESLERAKEDYETASAKISKFINESISGIDLIKSGSGIISQDRQAVESANLKKQLEQSQNAFEQAKLQAKMAQIDAEKALFEAERASATYKEEAEAKAKEAIEKAEQARLEAENKAAEQSQQAQIEIDKAKQEALEEAEKARNEIEKAKKEVESEAERIRREAEEDSLKARREAELETEKARREAEQEAERIKKEALEEAERVKKEAEAKEAQNNEEANRIAEKIKRRKLEISDLRRGLKAVENESQGRELKEKFYDIQLRLDADEKNSIELRELLERSMNDASHAAEIARYKSAANQSPRRVVKKVTERVNKISRPSGSGANAQGVRAGSGTRPAGARPAGARPAGARPAGARPAGARPAGARPAGTRPAGARPAGARPAGTRPAGTRPAGTRPAGTRPAGTRPAGTRPTETGTRKPPQR